MAASDYGDSNSPALVPGTLRVYRHFLLNTQTGRLMPMSWRPEDLGSPAPFDTRVFPPYDPGVNKAECVRYDPYGFLYGRDPEPGHEAPSVSCSCGFYAHYDDDEDFYVSNRWGKVYAELSGQRELAPMIIVRGVAQISGRTVMGKKGVRAEKIEILAIAVDWGKHLQPSSEDLLALQINRSYGQWVGDVFQVPSSLIVEEYYESPFEQILRDIKAEPDWATARTQTTARQYGVDFFDKAEDMYKAYPKENVDHLVDRTPAPVVPVVELKSGGVPGLGQPFGYLRSQVHAYSRQYGKTAALKGITADVVIIDEIIDTPEQKLTAFQKHMLAKQSKPAPPGTGIDRRRGRLR